MDMIYLEINVLKQIMLNEFWLQKTIILQVGKKLFGVRKKNLMVGLGRVILKKQSKLLYISRDTFKESIKYFKIHFNKHNEMITRIDKNVL